MRALWLENRVLTTSFRQVACGFVCATFSLHFAGRVRLMAENVQSAMLEILKRIQTDVSDVKQRLGGVEQRLGGVEQRVGGIGQRMERVEDSVARQRRDSAAMLVMMRGTVGVFDERLLRVEEDIRLVRERMGI